MPITYGLFGGKKIFPLRTYYPLEHSLQMDNLIVSMGDGFEQRVTKNLSWATYSLGLSPEPERPDGLGNNNISYRGVNKFGINIRNMQHVNATRSTALSSLKVADAFWTFYQDVNGNQESFWFYNPAENDPASLTSDQSDPKGRYLVRFVEDYASRTLFVRHLYNTSITLIEVRE